MCGIVGVVNLAGLTKRDIEIFTHTLRESHQRGIDASGIALQDGSFVKLTESSDKLVKTNEYDDAMKRAVGQQWLIGHARAATRGSPQKNYNNHPIVVKDGKVLLVHNGMVGSDKFKEDYSRTDTYVIAEAIRRAYDRGAKTLYEAVKDAYSMFYGSAATITISKNEVVVAVRHNPVVSGVTPSGARIFASNADFFPPNIHSVFNFKNFRILGATKDGNMKIGEVKNIQSPFYSYQSPYLYGTWHPFNRPPIYSSYVNSGDEFMSFRQGASNTIQQPYRPVAVARYERVVKKKNIPVRKHRRRRPMRR